MSNNYEYEGLESNIIWTNMSKKDNSSMLTDLKSNNIAGMAQGAKNWGAR